MVLLKFDGSCFSSASESPMDGADSTSGFFTFVEFLGLSKMSNLFLMDFTEIVGSVGTTLDLESFVSEYVKVSSFFD